MRTSDEVQVSRSIDSLRCGALGGVSKKYSSRSMPKIVEVSSCFCPLSYQLLREGIEISDYDREFVYFSLHLHQFLFSVL